MLRLQSRDEARRIPALTTHFLNVTVELIHNGRHRQTSPIVPRLLQHDPQVLAHPIDRKPELEFARIHRLPAVFHLPGLRGTLGDRIHDSRHIEAGRFAEVDRLGEALNQPCNRDLIDHLGELAGTRRPDPVHHLGKMRNDRLGPLKRCFIAAGHDGKLAIFSPRLPPRNGCVQKMKSSRCSCCSQLSGNISRSRCIVHENRTLPHRSESPIGSDCDSAQIVIIANTAKHEVGIFSGRRWGQRDLPAPVCLDPGFRFRRGPVVNRDSMTPTFGEVPRHRITHDAQSQKRNVGHDTPFALVSRCWLYAISEATPSAVRETAMPTKAKSSDSTPPSVTLAHIEQARHTIAGAVLNTDFDHSRTLSEMAGAQIWLKFENLQFTGSYKERGALNRLSHLTEAQKQRGVIAMSAGNHAQGVAYHAKRLSIPATIVMPEGTPTIKVENTRHHGAEVIVTGRTLEDSAAAARKLEAERGLFFLHPFDDPIVIAGQGTTALEMLEAVPELDTLVIPIGGGGLIAGMATAAKAIKPGIQVIGVEAQLYPSMYNRIKNAKLPIGGDTLAEGIAVKTPGETTSAIIERLVDDIVLVPEAALERAVALLIGIEKTVVEGAGAAGLAAVLSDPRRFAGRNIGLVLCGGNIDTRLLASVLTREQAREGRLSRLTIDIPDQPGQLAKVSSVIGNCGANIIEVYHQRVFTDVPAKGTELNLVIETRDRAHLQQAIADLKAAGYAITLKGAPSGGRG